LNRAVQQCGIGRALPLLHLAFAPPPSLRIHVRPPIDLARLPTSLLPLPLALARGTPAPTPIDLSRAAPRRRSSTLPAALTRRRLSGSPAPGSRRPRPRRARAHAHRLAHPYNGCARHPALMYLPRPIHACASPCMRLVRPPRARSRCVFCIVDSFVHVLRLEKRWATVGQHVGNVQ
jgi:hypothetical protein